MKPDHAQKKAWSCGTNKNAEKPTQSSVRGDSGEPKVGKKGCCRNTWTTKGVLSGESVTAREAESTGKQKSLLLC